MDVSAGRDSTWRRTTAVDEGDGDGGGGGGGGMEAQVVPPELYDSAKAKIEANLCWLFAKAYGIDDIPADLRDPFYTDQYEQEHIKPPIIHLLLSGELYCHVCGLILHAEQAASLQSHQSVIQALSRKGIHVLETDNMPVSVLDLSSSPIKMSSHIQLIDALMVAYAAEMISIEMVVSSVKRFSNISASKELPYTLEEAMVFWINKVNMKMRELTEKESKMKQHLLESPSHHKVRYRRDHLAGRTLQHFPLLEDLLKDVCDGAALLALIHFYCPDLIRLEDICLKEVLSIAESIYNIQLLMEFSNEYLNRCFHLKPEDLLYSPPVLKNNVMVFIAELFWWFENMKPDFVQPRDLQEVKDVRLMLQPKTSRSYSPVSSVTKRGFFSSSNSADILTTTTSPHLSTKPSSFTSSNSLLPLRHRQQKLAEDATSEVRNRPSSVARSQGKHQDSILAWPERRARPLSQPVPYTLHFAKEDEVDSISLARSISKDSLASNILSITPKHMLGSALPQHRLSGQSLLSHMHIEDEEEEIEEEELVSVFHPSAFSRHRIGSDMEQDELEIQSATSPSRGFSTSRIHERSPFALDHHADSYYLEPLMPAVQKRAKEKSITVNKQEESGEGHFRGAAAAKKVIACNIQRKPLVAESNRSVSTPKPVIESVLSSQSPGFFLHSSGEQEHCNAFFTGLEPEHDSDSDIADLEEEEEEDDQTDLTKEVVRTGRGHCLQGEYMPEFGDGEGESAKLREDSKVTEREDKEDASGRSSPCPSTVSWASSCSASGSIGVKMTSFAERKLLKLGLREGYSSTSSSQKTTPDGSETAPQWLGKESTSVVLEKNIMVSPSVVPSELLQLHMQLEEQRRAIEYQKKKMEALSARQRLKLGKAAFLNIVKKGDGKSDTLPLPLKHSQESSGLSAANRRKIKIHSCKDDSCLDALKGRTEGRLVSRDNKGSTLSQDNSSEPDVNECSRSIDLLNQAISSIQQQMMQLSFQQDLLMKQNVVSPPEPEQSGQSTAPDTAQTTTSSTSDSRSFAVHFVDISGSSSLPVRRPPKLSSSQRSKAAERKKSKTASIQSTISFSDCMPSSTECTDGEQDTGSPAESSKSERSIHRNATFRVHEGSRDGGDLCSGKPKSQDPPVISKISEYSSQDVEEEQINVVDSSRELVSGDESTWLKGQLIEVDLSELKGSVDDGSTDVRDSTADVEQKNVLGFFFKDDEKAEDEMAKRRAAFLLKQQRKAEEARLRKQQQEVESELKRDEARRKAEEERVRKEEEKARRELIKQEYLQRKQQALMEEQGLIKPRTRTRPRRNRPKSLHREDSSSLPKGSTTPDMSFSHRGSTLSLVTDADSVISGGAESNRAASVCSMDSFPVLSRTSSRNMERDWENGSIASSITSTEYNGPKLFKEPSSKSNKPIIINAIAHCCLAGKVNEVQKNVVLEELEKCESNHLIILFRDGGCQFRAIYSYSPDTEEIVKFTGTGPRTIGRKMIDKLYKYNSDRKQFTVIPAKSVSVSVDALTIHNHLWQVRRPGSARRK
ncbi:calmodulin-regulated spectrin-associated protein 1a isoform X6 [Nothobranchius furzeri]|uniref:Transcript variant X2 n=1 Tax=Nothobranchius furzeri TaxID=105023 RepID=A0A9D3BRV4_NOTFU|nr:transcript variant X2 [Nothobranchius furzeri]